jgi:hypothetical protein
MTIAEACRPAASVGERPAAATRRAASATTRGLLRSAHPIPAASSRRPRLPAGRRRFRGAGSYLDPRGRLARDAIIAVEGILRQAGNLHVEPAVVVHADIAGDGQQSRRGSEGQLAALQGDVGDQHALAGHLADGVDLDAARLHGASVFDLQRAGAVVVGDPDQIRAPGRAAAGDAPEPTEKLPSVTPRVAPAPVRLRVAPLSSAVECVEVGAIQTSDDAR